MRAEQQAQELQRLQGAYVVRGGTEMRRRQLRALGGMPLVTVPLWEWKKVLSGNKFSRAAGGEAATRGRPAGVADPLPMRVGQRDRAAVCNPLEVASKAEQVLSLQDVICRCPRERGRHLHGDEHGEGLALAPDLGLASALKVDRV